jgi:hypothetical protein
LLDDPPLPGTVEPLPLELQADRPKNRIRKPMRNRGELSMTLLPERGSTVFNGAEHPNCISETRRETVFQPLGDPKRRAAPALDPGQAIGDAASPMRATRVLGRNGVYVSAAVLINDARGAG